VGEVGCPLNTNITAKNTNDGAHTRTHLSARENEPGRQHDVLEAGLLRIGLRLREGLEVSRDLLFVDLLSW